MAGFATHVSVSGAVGLGFGVVGYASGLPPTTAAVGATLCALGGMLPDLDGDTGIAVREIVPLVAAAVPILMLEVFHQWGFDRETIFLAIIGLYFLIRFGIGVPFKKFTRHRGMWHSIPAAINCGLICFLICSYQELGPRLFKSTAIALGFGSHLILDEIWSLKLFRAKQSSGTAFKLFTTKRVWPNILTYGIMLGLFASIAFTDRRLVSDIQAWRNGEINVRLKPDWSRFTGEASRSSEPPSTSTPKETVLGGESPEESDAHPQASPQ